MNWSRVALIMKKDLKEVLGSKMVILPMIIVPMVFCLFLPGLFILLTRFAGLESMGDDFKQMLPLLELYRVPASIEALDQRLLYVMLNYTFLPFFLLIPIMVASIVASNAVVGEKERKTLETLLYTPVTNRDFLIGKLASAFVPAVGVTFITFLLFFAFANILNTALGGAFVVRSFVWIPALLLTSPAVSLLGLGVTLMVSLKAKTFMEAQQTAGLIVLPFILLVVGQATGIILLSSLYLVLGSLVLLGADYLIITRLAPRFNREAIIATL